MRKETLAKLNFFESESGTFWQTGTHACIWKEHKNKWSAKLNAQSRKVSGFRSAIAAAEYIVGVQKEPEPERSSPANSEAI